MFDDYYDLGEIKLHIQDNIIDDYADLKFVRLIRGVRYFAKFVRHGDNITKIEWVQVEDGQVCPENLKLRISRDLLFFLWKGFSKLVEKDQPSRVDAAVAKAENELLRLYIRDLRAMLFQSLGVEDPNAPMIVDGDKINPVAAEALGKVTGRTVIVK
jgi:hypothetical protein